MRLSSSDTTQKPLPASPSLFTPRQWETLRAAVDRIIPPDDFPGGWDAGVGDYLARQLSPGGDLAAQVKTYRAGLDALDGEASALFPPAEGSSGKGFAELGPDEQDALLARIAGEVEQAAAATAAAAKPNRALTRFFRLLTEHAQEGYYGDPGNGGNRDGIAWKMIGFEVRG